ncbi:uncharacterized protein LOC127254322 [Andrographis paniculata]|uniref:uncharacterized protein LOC127254322 n=1 Tax=Andrographis paniculata TaxID=175694 RepID=UPI0021E86049|nr:uncharacterized protein LOC127254322 [Andrographis paniculata]
MVSGSRIEGGEVQILSAGVRRTIQSIKEIVRNHSDADIYVVLKETNMDPNETTQKLLNQDPFHEVKRKRDKKKENPEHKRHVAAGPQKISAPVLLPPKYVTLSDHNTQKGVSGQNVASGKSPGSLSFSSPRKITEPAPLPPKYVTQSDRNTQRGGSGRNIASGATREFRIVRDNRVNNGANADSKVAQNSTSKSEGVISSGSMKSNSTESSGHQKAPSSQNSSQALNSRANSQSRQMKDSTSSGNDHREVPGERRVLTPNAASQVQTKANSPQLNSTHASSTSVAGVYSSSSDPVHVPPLHSKPAANIGTIRRDVGVVGPRRLSSGNSSKLSSSQKTSLPNTHSGQVGHSPELRKPFNAISESDQSSQFVSPEAVALDPPAGRPPSSNQHITRTSQFTSHHKAPQPNKEWKPKSSLKPSTKGPGVIGVSGKSTIPPPENSLDLNRDSAQMQEDLLQLNISESQNVIIAPHIRVSETDRCRLTFGSLGTNLDASMDSTCITDEGAELLTEPSQSVSVSVPEFSGNEPAGGNLLEMAEDPVRISGSDSPSSGAEHENKPIEKNQSLSQQNSDNYADVGLVQENTQSYKPESLQHQNHSAIPTLTDYGHQVGYEVSYFRPSIEETVSGLPSSQEILNSHTTNVITSTAVGMVQQQQQQQHHQQQQQQQLAQMYPQLHVSHFTNLMPYRQFISPVYVPPMPVPGYSNNPAYPHPTNGSSYVLMPGNSSHLTPSGMKYGIQQYKPVPAGSQTGFANYTTPTGYAVNTPGVVGGAVGHDDSSRLKYKDTLYVPNPQAETSEVWMSPREHPGLQSASYYNMPAPTPHPAYLTSHGSHASFNAAAQSSHMQFPGMYHPPPQPAPIASPHHLGPTLGNNVGVGVAPPAPGAQVGAYQQTQLGHFNWTGNF